MMRISAKKSGGSYQMNAALRDGYVLDQEQYQASLEVLEKS